MDSTLEATPKVAESEETAPNAQETERDNEQIEKGFVVFADVMAGDAFVDEVKNTTRAELKARETGAHGFEGVYATAEEAEAKAKEINES